jgi:hypothetical protein
MANNDLLTLLSAIEGEDLDVGEMVDLINGEDVDVGAVDLIGAMSRSGLSKLARARQLQRGNVDTVRSMGSKARRLFLGGEAVANSASPIVISIKAQEDYRVDRLVITALDSAGLIVPSSTLKITDIRCGSRSQFSSIGAISGDLFRPDYFANGSDLALDTVQAGTDLSIQISSAGATLVNPHTINVSAQGRTIR